MPGKKLQNGCGGFLSQAKPKRVNKLHMSVRVHCLDSSVSVDRTILLKTDYFKAYVRFNRQIKQSEPTSISLPFPSSVFAIVHKCLEEDRLSPFSVADPSVRQQVSDLADYIGYMDCMDCLCMYETIRDYDINGRFGSFLDPPCVDKRLVQLGTLFSHPVLRFPITYAYIHINIGPTKFTVRPLDVHDPITVKDVTWEGNVPLDINNSDLRYSILSTCIKRIVTRHNLSICRVEWLVESTTTKKIQAMLTFRADGMQSFFLCNNMWSKKAPSTRMVNVHNSIIAGYIPIQNQGRTTYTYYHSSVNALL